MTPTHCPFCDTVVDHTGCDCGHYLPTYDPEETP